MKRSSLFHILMFFTVFLLTSESVRGQTCSIVNIDTIICQGTTVSFTLNTSGTSPATYAWNFGNGFTANTVSASHTYMSPGTFTPTVLITFAGGGTCNATGSPIMVFGTPNASFNITTNRKMCFKDNELCIRDLSSPGSSNAPVKKRVYQLSNGFLKIDYPPFTPVICYKDTTDIFGYVFNLVMEITDTNNCVSKFQKLDSVELYPKFEKLDYEAEIIEKCNATQVNFRNTSLMPRSRVLKFEWQFGDGFVDSTNWFFASHEYTGYGPYLPMLIVTDQDLCMDTVRSKISVSVSFPDSAIYMNKPSTQCFRGNRFECSAIDTANFNLTWAVTDQDGNAVPFIVAGINDILFQVDKCGAYKVRLVQQKGVCKITTDSFIHVLGPKAIMEDARYKVINGKQCHIRDSVLFVTPLPYLSCIYQNGAGLKHLWNFDDAFAPQCTLDTRRGINLGLNCNFSRDSINVNHVYTPGKEKCYKPSLFIMDTIQGCFDSTKADLALTLPDASPAPSAIPPRKGLYTDGSQRCLGEIVTYLFDVLPECTYSRAFINLDSACGADNWILADTLGNYKYMYVYNSTCSPDGYVTVGLIMANGYDQAGNICYDTAWYHHIIRLNAIDAAYKISIDQHCKPFHVTFIPLDTIQYNLTSARWELNPGSGSVNDTVTQLFSATDSIVHSQSTYYPLSGVYNSYSVFTNNISCFKTHFIQFGLGYYANFSSSRQFICKQDSVALIADIFYYNPSYIGYRYPINFWHMPSRASSGLESVQWDIGDGNGFVYSGDSIKVRFSQPGKYTLRMVVQDSIGCYDTIVKRDYIRVIDTKANIARITQEYYCAPQIVLFRDSSLIYDSIPYTVPVTGETITSWQWDFGDHTLGSLLKNAGHNYTSNGEFQVRLIATSASGCSDTGYTLVNIAGPTPRFEIGDTLGCEPFTALFKNTTGKQLKSWTWYFGDSANQTFTTLSDSSVRFTYTKPGVYAIKLLASQDVTNPTTGNTTNCNSFFPDPVTGLPERYVYVLPTPPVGLSFIDSICKDDHVLFTSLSDSSYTRFVWRISNGDSIFLNSPDSVSEYRFTQSGIFTVKLVATHNVSSFCLDSASKGITVLATNADFEIDSSKAPTFRFLNTSHGANGFLWNFGKPQAGAANESNAVNTEFYFGPDTGTYKVCLTAFDALGCQDSVCKFVRISQVRLNIPNVFTPDNNDGFNDAFDIDIVGFTRYHLLIYNRWGAKVFEGEQDGYKNDGINWNGQNQQTGESCASGTYYYIFTYQLFTEARPSTVHGTVTLIRDK